MPLELDELLWRLYSVERDFEQHADSQRTTVITILMGITTAVLAVLGLKKTLGPPDLPLTIFLVFAGLFAFFFTWKLHERMLYHEQFSTVYFAALDKLTLKKDLKPLPALPDKDKDQLGAYWQKWVQLPEQGIDDLWTLAYKFQATKHPYMIKARQWAFYQGIPGVIVILGLYLTWMAQYNPIK